MNDGSCRRCNDGILSKRQVLKYFMHFKIFESHASDHYSFFFKSVWSAPRKITVVLLPTFINANIAQNLSGAIAFLVSFYIPCTSLSNNTSQSKIIHFKLKNAIFQSEVIATGTLCSIITGSFLMYSLKLLQTLLSEVVSLSFVSTNWKPSSLLDKCEYEEKIPLKLVVGWNLHKQPTDFYSFLLIHRMVHRFHHTAKVKFLCLPMISCFECSQHFTNSFVQNLSNRLSSSTAPGRLKDHF